MTEGWLHATMEAKKKAKANGKKYRKAPGPAQRGVHPAMKTIDELIDDVLAKEGGYSNRPNDRGGPTKFGITLKTLSDWRLQVCTADDVKALKEPEAREIYKARYYDSPHIHLLPEAIQPIVFDMAVNCGPGTAIKLVQTVCNLAGFGPIDVDGAIGARTKLAADNAWEAMGGFMINAIVDERKNYYVSIILADPTQSENKNGWMNRAESFRVEVSL